MREPESSIADAVSRHCAIPGAVDGLALQDGPKSKRQRASRDDARHYDDEVLEGLLFEDAEVEEAEGELREAAQQLVADLVQEEVLESPGGGWFDLIEMLSEAIMCGNTAEDGLEDEQEVGQRGHDIVPTSLSVGPPPALAEGEEEGGDDGEEDGDDDQRGRAVGHARCPDAQRVSHGAARSSGWSAWVGGRSVYMASARWRGFVIDVFLGHTRVALLEQTCKEPPTGVRHARGMCCRPAVTGGKNGGCACGCGCGCGWFSIPGLR